MNLKVQAKKVSDLVLFGSKLNQSNLNCTSLVRFSIFYLNSKEPLDRTDILYREANRCADTLANIGCIMGNEMMFYESCPTQINYLLTADQAGVTFPRLIKM
ncbi:hypothetical protein MTR_7g085230 [Medicago truncatula]|uniref:RNase H type-1 domain-containing protein n=1 Tax=Medicago truncatula TaxID=3880 RepID=G7KZD4_MEDTR|nr:hypothetical protein MTR_7g085230 [Medicago truncatula]